MKKAGCGFSLFTM